MFCLHVKQPLPPGNNSTAVNKYYYYYKCTAVTARTVTAVCTAPDAYTTPHSLRQASLSSVQTTMPIPLPTCSAVTVGTATNRTDKDGFGLAETFHVFLTVFQPEHEPMWLKHDAKISTTDDIAILAALCSFLFCK